jgi:hypothetical protein
MMSNELNFSLNARVVTMERFVVKRSSVKPPKELAQFFGDPPLALNEKQEDYESLFAAIAAAAKPADAIGWMFVRDITDLSWEIRRERSLKLKVIKTAEQTAVARMLTPPRPEELDWMEPNPGDDEACNSAWQWAHDPKTRRRIDKDLADLGYDATDISYKALEGNSVIDGIDKRIASYELRRMAALRAIELYSEKLARRLETASSEIIEGQFTNRVG